MSQQAPSFDVRMRRAARRHAVQAVYQWQLAGQDYETIAEQFIDRHGDEAVEWDYFKRLLEGVMREVVGIDTQLSSAADRDLGDLTPVELAVMRLAVYELMHEQSVPYKVVINEALELTKTYGSVEGFKYVNGVLDKLGRRIRQEGA